VLLAVVATSSPADAAVPVQVTFTLQGCNRPPGLTLPNGDGQFICPDADYTTGNQGPNWSELDLVPFRMTAKIGPAQTFTVAIAAANRDGGVPGYDLVSVPVLNPGLSDPTCQQPSVQDPQLVNNIGGFDVTLVRALVIPSGGNETCTYDWYQRLAVGSSGFPGASLDTRLVNENFNSNGIGQKTVSIPVRQVDPQTISKQIRAARGDGYLWSISKTSVPGEVAVDSCAAGAAGSFTTTLRWDRTPVTGAVTWTSQVFATNPSSRTVSVRVTDVVRADGQVVDTTAGQTVVVPGGSAGVLVLEHSGSAPPGTTTVSDTATATYVDPDTGVPVVGDTTATASAPVTVVAPGNTTATITDVTTADHPLALESRTSGSADVPLGTPVTTPITWTSGPVTGSGSATLTFAAPLARGFDGTVTVDDTAALLDSGGTTVSTHQSASLVGLPSPPRLTFVKTVDVPPTENATFSFSLWVLDANGNRTTADPVLQGPVTVPAGAGSSSSVEVTVPPSPFGYEYEEDPAPGYVRPPTGTLRPLANCDTLTGRVQNTREMGTISVTKVAEGDPAGADPTSTVHVDCNPGTTYDQDLVVAPGRPAVTSPIPSGTVCRITEPTPPDGYELVDISPSQVTVPAGDTPVSVTVTNRRTLGQLQIPKVLDGAPAGASTTFTAHVDCRPGATYDRDVTLTVTPPATAVSSDPFDVPTGVECTVTEPDPTAGWALSGVSPDGGVVTIRRGPNEVTLTNTRVQGSLVVVKRALGRVAGATTSFSVDVSCTNGFSQSRTLDVDDQGSAFATFDGIPVGTECTVSEPDPPAGWSLVDISPATVTVGSDPSMPVGVTVTNQRDTGDVHVVKVLDGEVAGAATDFAVQVSCPEVDVDQRLLLSVPGSPTGTVDGIPTGVTCTVAEPDAPPEWTPSVSPTTVTVGDSPAEVTVTNTRATGAVTVTKRLDGEVAGATTDFAVHLSCPDAGVEEMIPLTDANGHSVTRDGIPTGVTCAVTEPADRDGWALETIDPGAVVVGPGEPVQVTVTNRRLTGGISITKTLIGPVDGASTTFSAFLDCDGTQFDQRVSVSATTGNPGTVLVDGIPVGVRCTFTEVDIPHDWSLGGVASPDVTIDSTTPVEVNAVNTRRTGDVTVVKRIDGSPSQEPLSFLLRLSCSDPVFDTLVPVDLPAGATTVQEAFSGIPTGVTCRVSERRSPPGWQLAGIAPDQVVVGDQPVTVTVTNHRSRATPRLATRSSQRRVTPGTSFHDVVRVRGLEGGGGATATARLYGPFTARAVAVCRAPRLARTVRWHVHNGTNQSPEVRVRARGVYTWQVTTHADALNRAATHPCAQSAETTVVAKPAYLAPEVNGGYSGTLVPRGGAARTAPTRIELAAIGLDAPVLTERIRNGEMTLPDDVRDVGWLRRSAGFADKIGVTVVAGHVSDRHDHPGAMYHLSRARPGQHVTVRHAGESYRFTVVGTATYDRGHRLPHGYFRTTGRHRLVLISCTHRVSYPDGHFHYTRYQVVVADSTGRP
jgi:hypothetical protein